MTHYNTRTSVLLAFALTFFSRMEWCFGKVLKCSKEFRPFHIEIEFLFEGTRGRGERKFDYRFFCAKNIRDDYLKGIERLFLVNQGWHFFGGASSPIWALCWK